MIPTNIMGGVLKQIMLMCANSMSVSGVAKKVSAQTADIREVHK